MTAAPQGRAVVSRLAASAGGGYLAGAGVAGGSGGGARRSPMGSLACYDGPDLRARRQTCGLFRPSPGSSSSRALTMSPASASSSVMRSGGSR